MMYSFDLADLLGSVRDDVLSVALDIDPAKPEHQDAHPAWRTWLRNALRDLAASLRKDAGSALKGPADAVVHYLDQARLQGRGVALFAAPDLWRVFVLPVPLRNHVAYGRPDVLPLLWAMDEYEPYAILAVSRERVRLLLAYLGGTTVAESDALELDVNEWRFTSGRPPSFTKKFGTGASRGGQRDTFDARVDDHMRRFWSGAAQAADRYMAEWGIRWLVICGPEEAAHAVRDLLPHPARQKVVAIVPLADNSDPGEIHRRTLPVALAEEHRRDQALVDDVIGRAPGRAGTVVGLRDVLDAASREQLLTLVVDRDLDAEVYRCLRCDTVHPQGGPACPLCGGPLEAVPLAQVMPLLARRTGARLEFVGGAAAEALRPHGGIGAILRYQVR